jgi:predicted ATPase
MNPPSAKKSLLREILTYLYKHGSFPRRAAFRVKHEDAWDTLDSLVTQGFLNAATAYYILTPKGLRECDTNESRDELELCNIFIERLKSIYRQDANSNNPHKERTVAELLPFISGGTEAENYYTPKHLAKTLMFLAMEWLTSSKTIARFDYEKETQGTVTKVRLYEGILKVTSLPTKPQEIDHIVVTPMMQISMPRLSAINLQRFKAAFEPGVITLLPFTVLIGKNGSGKSTLIEALQWIDATLRQDAVNASARYFGVHDLINLRSRGLRPFFAIKLEWALDKKTLNYEIRVEEDDDHTTPRIATEELSTEKKKGRTVVLSGPESSDRLSLQRATGSPAENLQEFWRYAVFLRLSPNRMAEGSLSRRTSTAPLLDEEGQNLPALLNELNNEQRANLIDAVKSVLPHMEDVTVSKPSAGRSERVHYSLHERMPEQGIEEGSSVPIPAWMLSEGTRRLTAIFALLNHHPPPSLLCIEEVENGLDPWAVKILLQHLQSAADKGTQVLITTHSPWLLDHVPPETIIQARRVNGDTKYEIFADREAIKAYASSVPAGTRYVQDDE